MSQADNRETVLIVDDTPENIHILMETLKDDYKITAAITGEKALAMAATIPLPDVILLDIMMPEVDGYEVCRRLKADEKTKGIPVIFITAMSDEENEAKGLQLGAVDFITKPFRPGLVKARVRNHLELKQHRDNLETLISERTLELSLTQEVTIQCMASLAETRDPETGGHINRTRNYVRLLADHLKTHPKYSDELDDETVELLYLSAPLHDIGKVGVPDCILLKPGKLTVNEFDEMKKHTNLGSEALQVARKKLGHSSFLRYAQEIALTHHEKWDGTGYPKGTKGDDIPLSGRLMALADVYDALISKRIYKLPFTHEKAVGIIVEGSGTHFDPEIVKVFIELQEKFREIALDFVDFDEEREALSGKAPIR